MPTVSSMPFLKPHFHSNGASAAVAYKLYSYDSTTEDALPLYKDPAGSVEYPNPLVLNSRGEPDGMGLYLDNEKTYKLILKTAEDVEVWTVNAVQGVTGGGSTSVVTLPAHTAYANSGDSANVAAPVEIVSSITSETDDDLIASVGSVKEQVTNLQSDINTLSENLTCRVDGTPDQIVSTESVDEESGFKVFTESLSPTFVTRVTNIESSLLTKESLQYTGFRINSGSGPFFVKIAEASFQSGYGSMDLTCGVGGSSTAYGEFSVKVIRAINGTSMYAQWNSLFNRASTFQLEEIRCFYVGPNDVQLWAKTASPFTQSSLSFEPLINVRYSSSGDATGRAFSFQKVGTTGSYPSTYVNYCLAKSVDCLSASDQRRTEVTSDDASVEVTKTEVYDGKGYTNTFDLSVQGGQGTTVIRVDGTDNEIISTASADPEDPTKLIFTISLDPVITEAIATNTSDIDGLEIHIGTIENNITLINDTLDTLIPGEKAARSFPLSLTNTRYIKILDVDSDGTIPYHIDFLLYLAKSQLSLKFDEDVQGLMGTGTGSFKYLGQSCNQVFVYDVTPNTGRLVIFRTTPVDGKVSFFLVSYNGYELTNETVSIIDGHISGTTAEFSSDAYTETAPTMAGNSETIYLTHNIRVGTSCSGLGTYYSPIEAKATQVISSDETVDVTTTVTDGVTTHDLAITGGGGGGDIPTFVSIDASNSPYQAIDTATTVIVSTAAGSVVVTLPASSLKQYNIKWMLGTNSLTINVASSGSIDGQASFVVSALYTTGTSISLLCEESGTWVVI